MTGRIVMEMTDEQRQMVLAAAAEDVVCKAERQGGMFCGLVDVVKGKGISLTVARTDAIFETAEEAEKVAESVVEAVREDYADMAGEVESDETATTDADTDMAGETEVVEDTEI